MMRILVFWFSLSGHVMAQVDTLQVRKDILTLTRGHKGYRNFEDVSTLDSAAQYIKSRFKDMGLACSEQVYEVQGRRYRNIIASYNIEGTERLVIGAHYDVCGEQEGADDNASGVAGVLALAELFQSKRPAVKERVDFVAYTLEEPPFFRTNWMGSYVHAQQLYETGVRVKGMVCLEMIGYFDAQKGAQQYPIAGLKWVYGSKGDYITSVERFGGGRFARQFSKTFKTNCKVRAKRFKGFKWIRGLDFSDHLNYWHFGYSAVMITDTSFFRNPHYHKASDVIETLDLSRLGLVVEGVYESLVK